MKLLSLARDLTRRKGREREGLFVAEGIRTVEELVRSPVELRGVLIAPSLAETPRGHALASRLAETTSVLPVTEAELESASDTESPQGVLAVGVIPGRSLDSVELPASALMLVLDGIQDPGNVGTMIRSAAALGAVATVAMPGTVDLWNAKVVRSAMGTLFTYPAFHESWAGLDTFRSRHQLVLWGAAAAGTPLTPLIAQNPPPPMPSRLGLVVGNEGSGLSAECESRLGDRVAIPMTGVAESLNVAVAAGILMYELGARQIQGTR